MLYQIENGTVSCGGQVILSHIDFTVKGKEKIALTGPNGAGKTTLLRLIAGELELDRDDKRQGPGIYMPRRLTIGMLHQTAEEEKDCTVDQLILAGCPEADLYSRERYLYEMEYDRIFTGFGFALSEKGRKLSSFSGGEQTKISLIRLLLQKPELLLLDEPTNHLDIPAVEWLEGYLRDYDGAAVIVSHDRFFLDQVAESVYELDHGSLIRYDGNYSAYREQKQKNLARQQKAWERQQEEIHRLKELIEKFKHKPGKAAFARSRLSILNRMEKVEKPAENDIRIFTDQIEPEITSGKWVLEAEHLKIGYEKALLELSLRVRRGQKIAIIGENGIGKSTFLKTAAGDLQPLEGKLETGIHVVMGYFDQMTASISSDKRVIDHFHDLFSGMTEKEARQTLGAYLFSGKDASKKVSDLSGGEKSRLVLCELLTARPNLLLLDEPTNHMDIPARETLESAFRAYTGTILFVSHDRYFIDHVADAILVFGKNQVFYYPFSYRHYLEHVRRSAGAGDISARVTAENQALVADLRAVPKRENRGHEPGTEEAYRDWKLRLAAEPMELVRRKYEETYRQVTEAEQVRNLEALKYAGSGDLPDRTEEPAGMEKNTCEEMLTLWTEACLQWYDTYLETESGI